MSFRHLHFNGSAWALLFLCSSSFAVEAKRVVQHDECLIITVTYGQHTSALRLCTALNPTQLFVKSTPMKRELGNSGQNTFANVVTMQINSNLCCYKLRRHIYDECNNPMVVKNAKSRGPPLCTLDYDSPVASNSGPGSQRWMNKVTKDGRPYKKPGPQRGGPHDQRIAEIIQEHIAEGYEHIGGLTKTERIIQTPGGVKPFRRMDASFRDPLTGRVKHVNVGLKNLRGDPIIRERRALLDVINHAEGFKSDFLIKFRAYSP